MRESKRNEAAVVASMKGYKVHDDGSVTSHVGTRLTLNQDRHGYLRFSMWDEDETIWVYVHKLAAFQRFGNIVFEDDYEIRHENNVKSDNSVGNVLFGSHSENMMDVSPELRRQRALMSAQKLRKLTPAQARELRALSEAGWTQRKLAKRFGIAVSTTCNIINRKSYPDV